MINAVAFAEAWISCLMIVYEANPIAIKAHMPTATVSRGARVDERQIVQMSLDPCRGNRGTE